MEEETMDAILGTLIIVFAGVFALWFTFKADKYIIALINSIFGVTL